MTLLEPVQHSYARRSTDPTLTDHVLIVDDDEVVANSLCSIFHENGFEASTASSADEGLRMARDIRPRLLLSDVVMPDKSGIALMIEIAEELPTCHMIMMTGRADSVSQVNQQVTKMRNGVWVVLKPFNPEELVHKAGPILRRTRFDTPEVTHHA